MKDQCGKYSLGKLPSLNLYSHNNRQNLSVMGNCSPHTSTRIYTLNDVIGLSLWIVPDSRTSEQLKAIMSIHPDSNFLASRPFAPLSYPKFHPHITLASLPLSLESDLDIIEISIKAAVKLPQACKFVTLETGDHYYRSVYIRIKLSTELGYIHKQVHESFNVEPRTPAFPHLSLCYIDDADAAHGEREIYYNALKDSGKVRGEDESVSFIWGAGEDTHCLDQFLTHEIWVVRCEGFIENWSVLRKIDVSGT